MHRYKEEIESVDWKTEYGDCGFGRLISEIKELGKNTNLPLF